MLQSLTHMLHVRAVLFLFIVMRLMEFDRSFAEFLFEGLGEVGKIIESDSISNLPNAHIGLFEEFCSDF